MKLKLFEQMLVGECYKVQAGSKVAHLTAIDGEIEVLAVNKVSCKVRLYGTWS